MEPPGVFVFGSPIWLCCIPQRGGADSFGGPSVIAYYPDLSVIVLLDHLNSNSKGLVHHTGLLHFLVHRDGFRREVP